MMVPLDYLIYLGLGWFLTIMFFILFYMVNVFSPQKNSGVKEIIKGYRKKKKIILADNGPYWSVHLENFSTENGITDTDGGYWKISDMDSIKPLKHSMICIADGHRGTILSPFIMKIINECVKLELTSTDIKNVLMMREEKITPDDIKAARDYLEALDSGYGDNDDGEQPGD